MQTVNMLFSTTRTQPGKGLELYLVLSVKWSSQAIDVEDNLPLLGYCQNYYLNTKLCSFWLEARCLSLLRPGSRDTKSSHWLAHCPLDPSFAKILTPVFVAHNHISARLSSLLYHPRAFGNAHLADRLASLMTLRNCCETTGGQRLECSQWL